MSFDLTAVIRAEVRGMSAYQGAPAGIRHPLVKLDANESPFALGETVRENLAAEMAKALADVELHRYPDPESREVRQLLADDLGVSANQVLAANGSDEAILMLLMAVAGPRVAVAAPVPTFVMYETGAQTLGLRFAGIPLTDQFALDAGRFREGLRRERPRLTFLAWPNNPTGQLFDPAVMEEIIRACAGSDCHGLVVVDEAYTHYAGRTMLPRLRVHSNLVILRTLSKIGLAGIRLGMLVADPAIVEEINKVRLPYNVNALSQAAARVVLRHGEVVRQHAATIIQERERVQSRLRELPDLIAYPSDANFILIRTARSGDDVFRGLLERGVLVRNFSRTPSLNNCLRVTIGRPEENDAFLAALAATLARGD
jgi:histidinol-phosphate aminotransferase